MGKGNFFRHPKIGERIFGESGRGVDRWCTAHRGDMTRACADFIPGVNTTAAVQLVGENHISAQRSVSNVQTSTNQPKR